MKKYLLIAAVMAGSQSFAQTPEDALRFSWQGHTGSARFMAIGGAMGSLGGDLSAAYVNPAGLGFYKTSEWVLSPNLSMNRDKAEYRDGGRFTDKYNKFALGTSGWVSGFANRSNTQKTNAFAISINRISDLNSRYSYKALNNYSSFSEQFAEEFAKSGYSIDYVLSSNSVMPYSSAPALYTYLIDTVTVGNAVQVRAAPETILDAGEALQQEVYRDTKGGVYEVALAFAENNKDKWFWGVTLGIPIINYESNTVIKESDTSSRTNNGFNSATYTDNFTSNGAGVNLKLGVIYRPQDYIRLGFALHTPSFNLLTDKRTTHIINEGEGGLNTIEASSELFTNNQEGKNTYVQTTPWKALISASYVFREVENVKRQRGFITADIEYVNHKSSRFHAYEQEEGQTEAFNMKKSYFKGVNNIIRDQYKGTFNFRVGGELKFNVIMARLGFAYYGNPYKESPEKLGRMMLSGGLGYRHRGFFVDLTYIHQSIKNFDVPYRLEDRANTYAALKQNRGMIAATFGVKL